MKNAIGCSYFIHMHIRGITWCNINATKYDWRIVTHGMFPIQAQIFSEMNLLFIKRCPLLANWKKRLRFLLAFKFNLNIILKLIEIFTNRKYSMHGLILPLLQINVHSCVREQNIMNFLHIEREEKNEWIVAL